jgi:MFS family permease
MRSVLRSEQRLRWFFAAHLQGALGTGAGYVALMVLAYDRIGSAWGATAVLLADFLPAMLLGPLLGSLVDRTSRLGGAVASDLIRAGAFVSLAFADGTLALVCFALLAGFGTALFRPSTYALLPSLAASERVGTVNALFMAIRDAGQLLGLMLAAGALAVASPEVVLALNGCTFAASALLLTRLRGRVRAVAAPSPEQERVAAGGFLRDRLVRTLILASGVVTLCAATMNVGELALAQEDLEAGATGFALLSTAYGSGLVAGTLCAGRDGGNHRLAFFAGLGGLVVGMLATSLAPGLALALCTFALTGAANGLFTTSKTTMLHRAVPERMHGRAFGLQDALDSWGFGAAVVAGGALTTAFGGRALFAIAGAALALVLAVLALALPAPPRALALTSPAPV